MRHRVANFASIIEIAIISNKAMFKDSTKAKEIENFVLKCNFYLYFPV